MDNNAVALFSGSPISASSILKPARKRKSYKKAKTYPETSCDTGSYKVLGSFGDVEYKKRRIQQVDNKNNTDTGFIQYLTGDMQCDDVFLRHTLTKHTGDLWQSNSNPSPSKDRDFTTGNTKQNYCFQVHPERVNVPQSIMANCPDVQTQQDEQSVARAEKKCQASRSLNDTSDCNQVLPNTNEVAQLDSFSLIFYDIVNSASMFEPANSEVVTQCQDFSATMTTGMSQGLAPVLPPLTSLNPLPKGPTTSASLIGNFVPKTMSKVLTSQTTSEANLVSQTISNLGPLYGKASNKRNSSPLTTNSLAVTPLTSRNSVSLTSSQIQSGNHSQQLNNSMQWTSNHADLVQARHIVPLEQQKGQSLNPISSAQLSPSRASLIKSFNGQSKQIQEDLKRTLRNRMLKEFVDFSTSNDNTFQELFAQTTNSMPGGYKPVQSAYTAAAIDEFAPTSNYTSSHQNYPEAQSTYITEKSLNKQLASIPSTYTQLSNTQLSNTQASFRQTTNTQPANYQHAYNQTTSAQPAFGQKTKNKPAFYQSAHTLPLNTQTSNIQASFRQTTNTQPTDPQSANNQTANLQPAFRQTTNIQPTNYQPAHTPLLKTNPSNIQTSFRQTVNSQSSNPQSAYTQAATAQPEFIHTTTTNKQPTNAQLAYTQPSNSQISNLQMSFRQTTNTQPANPQHAYLPDSTTYQPEATPTQEPMDYLLTPPPYTSTSNNFTATFSDSFSAQFKTKAFGNDLLNDLNTPMSTVDASTPDFTSLSNLGSFPSSPKAEDDLLSSNTDSFYLSSIPSICFA